MCLDNGVFSQALRLSHSFSPGVEIGYSSFSLFKVGLGLCRLLDTNPRGILRFTHLREIQAALPARWGYGRTQYIRYLMFYAQSTARNHIWTKQHVLQPQVKFWFIVYHTFHCWGPDKFFCFFGVGGVLLLLLPGKSRASLSVLGSAVT